MNPFLGDRQVPTRSDRKYNLLAVTKVVLALRSNPERTDPCTVMGPSSISERGAAYSPPGRICLKTNPDN
jgi:hypothetical protein